MSPFVAGALAGFVGVAGFIAGSYEQPKERDPFANRWNCANFDQRDPHWSDTHIEGVTVEDGGKTMFLPFQCSTLDGVRHFSESLTFGVTEACELLAQHQPPITCQENES